MLKVTILILIDGFLQYISYDMFGIGFNVTILILIDGFLQFKSETLDETKHISHNPYFNRWFSAIGL